MVEHRDERSEDLAAIRALIARAFGADSDTPAFVDAVRKEAGIALAELAVADGAIVGHAQWCDAPVFVDGQLLEGAYLACLAVEPARQRRGVGSQLVRSGLNRLKKHGYRVATLLGEPAFYGRFGFSSALAEKIEAPHRARGAGFQAIALVAGALGGERVVSDFPAVISWGLKPVTSAGPSN